MIRHPWEMVENEEPSQLSRGSDIEDGGFWLNQLNRILAKIGQCKDEQVSPKIKA